MAKINWNNVIDYLQADAMGADILRFGAFATGAQVDNIQVLYRVLIGGISTVGEPLATSIILGMPVLKDIIGKAIMPTQPRTLPRK